MRYRFGLDHVALLVRDVGRSVAFYRDVMGFSPIARTGSENVEWLEIGGGDAIHLIQADFGATHVTKDTHVAVSTADFDRMVADLTESGISFTDWPGNPGQIGLHRNGFRQIYVQDPDGYWIEINDHRPPAGVTGQTCVSVHAAVLELVVFKEQVGRGARKSLVG